ncbi:cbb3-type cytochrome c oxidase subunit II [Echinicola marina]|nr:MULTISPECIES: cbb3-type cytochrome c oxidase subunit II [Echinicola]UCS93323.1 cbb3-type cytochrome c oxidase subunit II [Echinicola marina]
MLDFHKNHQLLLVTILTIFVVLSLFIAVFPAFQLQENNAPLPAEQPMTSEELRGMHLFISEGCVACHTQQVRGIEMDKIWGQRPSMPSDYYYSKKRMDFWRQSPSLLGSERTGPDLTNVGQRQPGDQWHLLHLYNPRSVVEGSIMPSYPWLFDHVDNVREGQIVLEVPKSFKAGPGKVVATQEVLDLVAYLKSLKQTSIPVLETTFIPAVGKDQRKGETDELLPDGAMVYANNCAACHQGNGEGVAGAFPPLAGSSIVNDEDPQVMIQIILQGYDARPDYGQMPPFADLLTDEEIAVLVNHERSSWGNNAPKVSTDLVRQIREMVNKTQK